jgi:hypothetical protein
MREVSRKNYAEAGMIRSVGNSSWLIDKTLIQLAQDKSIPITLFVGDCSNSDGTIAWHSAINLGSDNTCRAGVISLLNHIADAIEEDMIMDDGAVE